MTEALTIIPAANHALRADLALFVQQQDELLGARILLALLRDPIMLFVHVTRQVGAMDEPAITAADLSLMQLEDGRTVRLVMASTKLTPDNLSTELEARGIYCRQLPSKALFLMCLERGIVAIDLDSGLPTGVMIGPFAEGKHIKVSLAP